MRIITTTILFFVCLATFSQTASFSSNFEDQTTDPEIGHAQLETGTSGGFFVVPNPAPDSKNNSSYVLKTYTNEGTGGRAEYSVPRHETNEKTYFYTWKRYHSVGHLTDIDPAGWYSYNQWKTWPCEYYGYMEGYEVYRDLICDGGGIFNDFKYHSPSESKYLARAKPDCKTDYFDVPEGQWNSFVLEVYWTSTSDGYYNLWMNDSLMGYGSNMKTLFDQFLESTCDIYWSNGIYSGWWKSGAQTQDSLIAYVDDIGLYDIDSGYTKLDICPNCEEPPVIPTDSLPYRINVNYHMTIDGWSNYITNWNSDTNAIDIGNIYGQNNGIDVYMSSALPDISHNSLSDDCFPTSVIMSHVSWSDANTYEILLQDLTPTNTYTFKLLSATTNSGSNQGVQIWTNETNRDTCFAASNLCNVAEITNLSSDANGDLTINVSTINGGTGYINAIEIIEYTESQETQTTTKKTYKCTLQGGVGYVNNGVMMVQPDN